MSRRGAAFVAILEKTMSAKRSGDFRRQPIVIASTVGPLGDAELSLAVVALADIAPQWSVELQGICSEQTTLVLLPEDGDDENGPSFVVSREAYGFRLDQIHWDAFSEVGVFTSFNDVLVALRVRLGFCSSLSVPASVTIH